MPVFLAFLIPCAAVAYLLLFHRAAVSWWEPVALLAAAGILVSLVSLAATASAGLETEYKGTWVSSADYVEPWDEEVPCRHPRYRTDDDGNMVQDGYQHAYDVDYHPAEYVLHGGNGVRASTTADAWRHIAGKFGNSTVVDMHRGYHTIDGDVQRTTWPNGDESRLEPMATETWYRNPTQAHGSTFRYRGVGDDEAERYGLYPRPEIVGHRVPSVLGYETTGTAALDRLNAIVGTPRQVQVFLLAYPGQPLQASHEQEALWDGGRRNELVVTVGLDTSGTVEWARAFSWSDSETLKVEIRDYLVSQGRLDTAAFAAWLRPRLETEWACRDFADFSHLRPEPSWWATLLAWLVLAGASVGMSAWVVGNEYDAEDLTDGTDPLSGWLLALRDGFRVRGSTIRVLLADRCGVLMARFRRD